MRDHTDVRDTLVLANLYMDLAERGSRFVPYVGVGAGIAVRNVEREHLTTETLTNLTDPLNPVNEGSRSFAGKGKAHQVAPAAAVTAGLAYTLSPGMVIDVNYRFAYLGQVDFTNNIEGSGSNTPLLSRMTIGDNYEHALRAGLRWNVW